MTAARVINVDLADVYATREKKGFVRTLAWGDEVEVVEETQNHVEIRTTRFETLPDGSIEPVAASGFVVPSESSGLRPADVVADREESRVLKVDFVDVQQGDAAAIETPEGKVILVDGGENQLFARYLASRYRRTSEAEPKDVECVVVTHGDADHFSGLAQIRESEAHLLDWKRLFIRPKRIYHNGLVKGPSALPDAEAFGETVSGDGVTIVTGLEEDLLGVDDDRMNEPFRRWKGVLEAYDRRGPIEFRRLSKGDDAFDFLAQENIGVEVLGPIPTEVAGAEGLRFLGEPEKGPRVGHHSLDDGGEDKFSGRSASHTINGHSVVLRLTYGGFRFLFAGDLNEEAELDLAGDHEAGQLDLRSEVLKVPHHGSDDFLPEFMAAVSPVVSVVSSGDESARKEYMHPRATLMAALGKHSRDPEPVVFVTELVAFFEAVGFVRPEFHRLAEDGVALVENDQAAIDPKARGPFFAFNRAAFGLVRTRTDGERLLVYTNSGRADYKEAYAYRIDAGECLPARVRRA